MQDILLKHATPVLRGNCLRPRLIAGRDHSLLAVFNDHRTESCTEMVPVPKGFRNAKNIVDGTLNPIVGDQVLLTVEPENVIVLLLEA